MGLFGFIRFRVAETLRNARCGFRTRCLGFAFRLPGVPIRKRGLLAVVGRKLGKRSWTSSANMSAGAAHAHTSSLPFQGAVSLEGLMLGLQILHPKPELRSLGSPYVIDS